MNTVTLVTLSPEEIKSLMAEAVKSALIQTQNPTNQSILSVVDIAKDSGFSPETVRSWILIGRTARGGRKVKLKIMDGISDTYRVRWEAYRSFLNEFPDIVCPTPDGRKKRG